MQDDLSLRITGLPVTAPDQPATVVAIGCDDEPEMRHQYAKKTRSGFKVGVI